MIHNSDLILGACNSLIEKLSDRYGEEKTKEARKELSTIILEIQMAVADDDTENKFVKIFSDGNFNKEQISDELVVYVRNQVQEKRKFDEATLNGILGINQVATETLINSTAPPSAIASLSPPPPSLTGEEKKLLGYRDGFPSVSMTDFTHLHSSARIHGTKFDGGYHVDKYNYWENSIELLKKDPSRADPKAIRAIDKVIRDGQLVNKLVAKYQKGKITADEVVDKIKEALKKERFFYLPSGWNHEDKETDTIDGHFAIIKFKLDENGDLRSFILNKGGGSELHPPMEVDGSKLKRDIRSLTAVISKKKIEKKSGLADEMLKRILQLETNPTVEQSSITPLSEADLYGLLYLFAEKIEKNDVDPFFAATPQRAGSCTEASLDAAFVDASKEVSGMTRDEMKAFMFKFKQESLIHGFVQYYEAAIKDPDTRLMLKDAAEQHAIRALKREDHLTEEERQKASGVAKFILERLEKMDVFPTKHELSAEEVVTHEVSAAEVITVNSVGKMTETEGYQSAQVAKVPHLAIKDNVRDPKLLAKYLTDNLAIARKRINEGCDPTETFEEVYRLMTSLPHGREKVDGNMIWNSLPSSLRTGNDADKCFDAICQLNEIMAKCAIAQKYQKPDRTQPSPILDKSKMLEVGYRSYDIAAQLVLSVSSLKKASKDMGFTFNDDLIVNRKIFSHPKTIAALEQVRENFKQRNQNKEEKKLFPLSINDSNNNHIVYVKKLYGELKYIALKSKSALNVRSSTEAEVQALMTVLHEKLPRQYYQLETLAFMTEIIKRHGMVAVEEKLRLNNNEKAEIRFHYRSKTADAGSAIQHVFPFKAGVSRKISGDKQALKDENAVYLKQNLSQSKDNGISPAIKQELLALETDPKPELIFAWAVENLGLLENPFVQKEIENILFKHEVLPQSIKASPEELKANAKDFFQRAYEHYSLNPTNIDTVLWLLRISDSVTNYFMGNGSRFEGLNTQDIYKQLNKHELSDEVRGRLIEHQLDHFNYTTPSTPEDYETILRCTFEYAKLKKSLSITTSTMSFKAQEVILAYYGIALAKIAENNTTDSLPKFLLSLYGIKPKTLEVCSLKGNELKYGPYSFFLNQGLAFKEQKYLNTYAELLKGEPLYEKFFSHTGFVGVVKDGFLYEEQGKVRLGLANNKIQFIEREIKGTWYRYTEKPDQPLSIPASLNGTNYVHWVSCDANHPQVIISKNDENILSTPLYVYSKERGLRVCDSDGDIIINRGLDLSKEGAANSIESTWRAYLSPIESVDHILVEVTRSANKERVDKITLPRMGLTFEKNAEGLLESTRYKGYYLSPKFNSPFNSFKGAMVLENAQGQTKVIIPSHPLTELKAPKDSIATTTKVETDTMTFMDENVTYFTYEGKKGQPLKATTPEAALYIALIYRNEKQYEKAFSYLESSFHPNKNNELEWTIARQVLNQKDYSSGGIAYDLHLCKRMQDQEGKISRQSNTQEEQTKEDLLERTELQTSFSQHMVDQRRRYLNYISNEKKDVYQIPERFRLTPAMEQALSMDAYRMSGKNARIPIPLSDFSLVTQNIENGEIHLLTRFKPRLLSLQRVGVLDLAKLAITDKGPTAERMADNAIKNLSIQKKKVDYRPGKLRMDGDVPQYIYNNFNTILNSVCSDNEDERKLATIDLLFLSRNNKETALHENTLFLIDILLYASQHIADFRKFAKRDNEDALHACIVKIIEEEKLFVDDKQEEAEEVVVEEAEIKDKKGKFFASAPEDLTFDITHYPSKHKDPTMSDVVAVDALPDLNFQNINKPMTTIYNEFFTPGKIEIKKSNFTHLLSNDDLKKADSPLAKAQMLAYNNAKGEKEVQEHKFNAHVQLGDLKTKLESQQTESQRRVEALKAEIIELANKNPLDESTSWSPEKRQMLMKLSGQKRTLNFEDVLAGYLAQDISTLKKANPFLSVEEIQAIFGKLLELYLHESQKLQANEALGLVKQIEKSPQPGSYQKLGEVLARKRLYDPKEYPLLAIYEGSTGRMLRADQVDAIKWAMTGVEKGEIKDALRLLQAFAGFGKTKVFTTIIAMMLAQKGYLPTIVNITNLYDFGKSDLGNSLMQAFKQRMEVFEVHLGSALKIEDLKRFHANLLNWQQDKKCLVIVPESWHYLNIQYKDAVINNDKEKLAVLEGIQNFFKENGFIISDEAHLICNPLQEAIKAVEKPKHLPMVEMDLFIKNYQVLAQNKTINLREGGQSFVTDKELPEIKKQLIEASLNYEIFASEKGDPRLKEFLGSPLTARPEWLVKMMDDPEAKELAELISLQHGFIQAILQHVLSQKEGIDYGESTHSDDLTTAPKHDREPTEAKFSDEYIWTALSIQHRLQKGVPLDGCKVLLAHLKDKSEKERLYEPEKITTDAQRLLDEWLKGTDLKVNLLFLSLKDEVAIQKIYDAIYKKEDVINHYLIEEVLPQIEVYNTKITSTPAEMLEAFAGGLLLTATPGAIETLPVAISLSGDKNKLDPASEAETIETMLADRNKHVAIVDSYDPNTFFEEVLKQNPNAFKDLAYMVDRGAGFRNVDSQDVVKKYLEFVEKHVEAKRSGAIYVDNAPNSKERTALFLNAENKETKILEGSDLAEALRKQGVDTELLSMAFYYYSIRETTGTDWVLPKPSKGLFTVGEQQTATQSIQAVKRDRQFNAEDQSITWVMPKKLLAAMGKNENDKVIPKEIIIWMINNEAREQEKKIWMRFQQGLDCILVQKAKEKQKKNMNANVDYRTAVMKKENNTTHFNRFYEPPALEQLGDKQEALSQIVLDAAKPLGVFDFKGFTAEEQRDLQALIDQTAALMNKLTVATQDFKAESIQETVKEQKQEQEQEKLEEQLQEALTLQGKPPKASFKESYEHEAFSIASMDFPKKERVDVQPQKHNRYRDGELPSFQLWDDRTIITPHFSINRVLNLSDNTLPELIISDPFMITGNNNTSFIRPPKAVLVQIDRNVSPPAYKYIALSTKGYTHYKKEIVDQKNNETNKEYVILNLHNGPPLVKTRDVTPAMLEDLKESEETKKILSLTALMNGRINNVDVVAKMVAPLGKSGFNKLMDSIGAKAIALNFKVDKIGVNKVYEKNAKLWQQNQ